MFQATRIAHRDRLLGQGGDRIDIEVVYRKTQTVAQLSARPHAAALPRHGQLDEIAQNRRTIPWRPRLEGKLSLDATLTGFTLGAGA